MTSLTIRAAGRVLLRVLAKSAAYIGFGVFVFWSELRMREAFGPSPRWLIGCVLGLWGLLALLVFRDKVREEAQRIGGRS